MNEFWIPEPELARSPWPMCGAEFVHSKIEYAPMPDPDGGYTFCTMPKGHKGAHIDDSAAGRIAWMTIEELEALK